MSSIHPLPRSQTSLEVLRAEARQEIETVVHERLVAGEDPWEFMEELLSVDELTVYLLRAPWRNVRGPVCFGSLCLSIQQPSSCIDLICEEKASSGWTYLSGIRSTSLEPLGTRFKR